MLTIIFVLFATLLLAHFFADVIKAAVVVAAVLGVFYLVRDVSFSALANEGARDLYNATSPHPQSAARHIGRRI